MAEVFIYILCLLHKLVTHGSHSPHLCILPNVFKADEKLHLVLYIKCLTIWIFKSSLTTPICARNMLRLIYSEIKVCNFSELMALLKM